MKKENRLSKFVVLVVFVTMVALILLSSTYAKYTTSLTGSDTATVAKWQVKLNDNDVTSQSDITTFDLFTETGVYDLNGLGTDLSSATAAIDDEVIKSGSKIAPGTWGKVDFKVENTSDVAADYVVKINSLTTTLPLQFSVDGKTWVEASTIATATPDSPYDLGTGTLAVGAGAETVSLYWKWDFERTDKDSEDTGLGAAGTATCAVTAGIVFTQVD